MATDRPNVLLICTDQQRFDALGCYGNEWVETPNLDALAAEGVRFDRCYSQSPVCTPSRASFTTGRYPRTTTARQNGQSIADDETPFTRQLADAGYTCGLAGKLHVSAADPADPEPVPLTERRIDDGFAEVHWSHDPRLEIHDRRIPTNEYHHWLRERGVEYDPTPFRGSEYVETSVAPEHHHTTWCARKAATFAELVAPSPEPWAFVVNTFDPHVPFDPPEAYLRRYLDRLGDVPLPDHAEGEREDKPVFQRPPPSDSRFPFAEMDPSDHRLVRAAYWAMCDLIDDAVGQMLDALEATGQREDTLVVFTSDHGEMLGDHGIYLKGPFFYEPAIRVPLIVSGPGVASGAERDALVELVDLAPTVLDAAGVEAAPGMHGRSFRPLLADGAGDDHRSSVYCEYYHALERPQFYDDLQRPEAWGAAESTAPFHAPFAETDTLPEYHDALAEHDDATLPYATMVRTERYKLVEFHGLDAGELYDLENDPAETNNRYRDDGFRDAKLRLRGRLLDRMAGTIDPLPQRRGRY